MGINSRPILYDHDQTDGSDERLTPAYGVRPIVKYITEGAIVWCPFDAAESQFVKVISAAGFSVEYSHKDSGQNFFDYEPPRWDIIISNPPFRRKREFFRRAISFGKPFALLMTNTWLNDAAPKQLFKTIDLQLLMFEERIKYTNPFGVANDKITFSSSYYCRDFLPKQIIMESLQSADQYTLF